MVLMGFVSKLSSVICHFSPVVSISLSGNNMALSENNMALSGDKMALSEATKILGFLTKKVLYSTRFPHAQKVGARGFLR